MLNVHNLKQMDVVSRLYEYFYKKNNKKVIQMKTGMNVNLNEIKMNLTMSDIEVFNHFVDNNIDEKSEIFTEEDAIFNSIDLEPNKEAIKRMSEIRIIKRNLIHVQGLPKSLAIIDVLKSDDYKQKCDKKI